MHLSRLPSSTAASSCDCPYLLPWQVTQRSEGGLLELRNVSAERLTFVRFAVAGTGELALTLPRHAEPGETISVAFHEGCPPGAESLVTMRWFRPNGREYLWVLSV